MQIVPNIRGSSRPDGPFGPGFGAVAFGFSGIMGFYSAERGPTLFVDTVA